MNNALYGTVMMGEEYTSSAVHNVYNVASRFVMEMNLCLPSPPPPQHGRRPLAQVDKKQEAQRSRPMPRAAAVAQAS